MADDRPAALHADALGRSIPLPAWHRPRTTLRRVMIGALAIVLLAHGAIHLWWLAPPSPEAADLVSAENAWAVERGMDPDVLRGIASVLAPATALLFAASAAGLFGWLPARAWRPTTLAASVLSLVLLGLYFDPAGWIGVTIDVVLLVVILTPLPQRLGIPLERRHSA